MSMALTGSMQGSFVSAGLPVLITLRSGFDRIRVFNKTRAYLAGADTGVIYEFDPYTDVNGRGAIYVKTAVTDALTVAQLDIGTGFFIYDSSIQQPGASVALTGIDNSAPPVVTTGNTAGLFEGDVVRIYRTVGAVQLEGMDFTIGNIITNTSFELTFMDQIVNANPGAGTFRKIPYDPIYYPRHRFITHITNDAEAVVTFSVTHGYKVGQKLAFSVPAVTATEYGMTEMNGLVGTVLAVDTVANTVTVDINSLGFSAWAFPLTAAPAFTPAMAVPAGTDTAITIAQNVPTTNGAYFDDAKLGVLLMPGSNGPAGVADDVISWVAGYAWNK